jgi:hypothetical protein
VISNEDLEKIAAIPCATPGPHGLDCKPCLARFELERRRRTCRTRCPVCDGKGWVRPDE